MPELPEVETVRKVLQKKIVNKKIIDVKIYYDKIIKTDLGKFKKNIMNQTIREIERLGKYLLIRLDDYYLISHLRMEGKYHFRNKNIPLDKHDHIVFDFHDFTELRYNDVRKFGTMHLKAKSEVYLGEPLAKLGLEPFDEKFTIDYLKKHFKSDRAIKNVLLDQERIAGLGNIYVNEVLFMAKIHPETRASLLEDDDILKIKDSTIRVLTKAIELGGSTIRSYYSDDNITGKFQNELQVHQRKDESCFLCKSTIIKIKVGGRGTYLCPKCQIKVDK